MQEKRMTNVFVNFAKAFYKVNYRVSLKKVAKHIKGKLHRWIKVLN